VKKFLKFLGYLPVILMAIFAILIVLHMWRVTEEGRSKVAIKKNRIELSAEGRSSTGSTSPASGQ
jgi:hypothetical protein